MQRLSQMGFRLIATEGTADILTRNGVPVDVVAKHSQATDEMPSIVDLIRAGEVDLVINTPSPRRDSRADNAARSFDNFVKIKFDIFR
jgi:carbamoyl-phosphate synthase large subunit